MAEQMGEAYARIRDAINNGSALTEVDQSAWLNMDDMIIGTQGQGYDRDKTANPNDFAKGITAQVVTEPDDNSDETTSIVHSDDRDPIATIASDLGSKFKTFADTFTEAKAKTIAAAFFGTALKALNSHVVSKTPLPPAVPEPPGGTGLMRNINEYYKAYADDPRSFGTEVGNDMALFTWQDNSTGDYFTGGYFSSYFVELSTTLNITINDEFKASTWA